MNFQLCENTGFFLRLGLVGPSGSGKTYTALGLATELGHRVGIIDTEGASARRYARAFSRRFETLELSHFSPRDYIEAIRTAEAAGIEVLVIDSLSHAWIGRGGVLEMVDVSARRQARGGAANSFSGWREVTPEHNRLVDALVHAKMHVIVTMRTKTEYVVEKTEGGKSVPRKVGLAPVQREGLEYEFDIVGDLSMEHELVISKTRCSALADRVIARPGAELAQELRAWLDGAEDCEAATTPGPQPDEEESWQGARCDSCRAPIVWLQTAKQQRMPVLPHRLDGALAREGEVFDPRLHVTHFIDCPQADQHRRGGKVETIQPWLRRIAAANKAGTAADLAQLRHQLNTALPAERRNRAQGDALRRALTAAELAISLRCAPPDPPPAPPELRVVPDHDQLGALPYDS